MPAKLDLSSLVLTLKAAAESSRLRILSLLASGDLTVSDLTEILGQSQPRVSRHLKLLADAGLIERYQEGSWAFFTVSDADGVREFISGVVGRLSGGDAQIGRDNERLADVKRRRQVRAAAYFSANAGQWDELRAMHAADGKVEDAIHAIAAERPFRTMLDIGTGTGRLLEVLAPLYRRGIGIDLSRDMLDVARANLDRAGTTHAQVRHGDLFSTPVEHDAFDLVTMHQVLHYLENPAAAIREAAKHLRPSGRLIIADFAPHAHEHLRHHHQHLRLGFTDRQVRDWMAEAGLEPGETVHITADEPDSLTVMLWHGHDRRLLIANPSRESLTETA